MVTKNPSIPLTRPYFSETSRRLILEEVDQILASGKLVLGPHAERFEDAWAKRVGTPYAVSVNSCTTGMQIALQHLGVEGAEVLVPAGSFVSDVAVATWNGARAVLVDIDRETLTFDMDDLRRKVTPKTRAMIWVHLVGFISPKYREIQQFAKQHNLLLIEDAAHAHGAIIDGREAGGLGDVGCFSFYATKVVTASGGGMMTLSDPYLVKFAKEVRHHGRDPASGKVVQVGNDWFLDEVRACIGYHQLMELDQHLARRRWIAARYDEAFRNQPGLFVLDVPETAKPAYYQYPVWLDSKIDPAGFIKRLQERHGVTSRAIYRPIHTEPAFASFDDGTLANTEAILRQSLCLPMSVAMTDDEVAIVIDAVTTEARANA